MTKEILIKRLLTIGFFYLLVDALIHLLNIRLIDVESVWPANAVVFSGFLSQIYASFVLLVSFLIWEIRKDINKYKNILTILGFWAVGHGVYLLIRTTNNLPESFGHIPSLMVWSPFYSFITAFEGGMLIFFGTIVILWRFKYGKNN
jgi:uncharacterized membrane protein YvlD (DUF360 family)